jgi:hypothetical protein
MTPAGCRLALVRVKRCFHSPHWPGTRATRRRHGGVVSPENLLGL